MNNEKKIGIDEEQIEEEFEELSTDDRIINIEKRVNIILILCIVILFFSLCSMVYVINYGSEKTTDDSQTTSEESYTYDTSAFKEITAADIKSESKGKTIVVVIARQGCYYCSQYMPIIASVAESYDVTVEYIDFAKIVDFTVANPYVSDKDAYDTIANLSAETGWENFGETAVAGTPNTLFIKDNKIIYGINGAQDESTVKAAFKAAGLG